MNTPKIKRIPSLAEIAHDPALISDLDPDVASALGAAFSGLSTSCALRAVVAQPDPTPGRRDRALSLKDAADLLGVHEKTLARRARVAPFDALKIDLGGVRRVRFSEARVRQYLHDTQDRPEPRGPRSIAPAGRRS